MTAYLPILIALLFAIAFVVLVIVVSTLVVPMRRSPAKNMPYESGVDPLGDARQRFHVRFYLVGVLFILFDIETVFLYPWAVTFRRLGLFGLVEMALFVAILFVGYFYVLGKRGLEWD